MSNLLYCFRTTRYEYLWEDGVRYKRPTKLPAPEYVDALMNWTQSILDDEAVFPNTIGTSSCFICFPASLMKGVGVSFPRTFKDTVRTIVRRLFRVYAHIYSNHFDQICALGIEGAFHSIVVAPFIPLMYTQAHLNTSYRHFFLFINEVCRPLRLQSTHYLLTGPTV